MHLRCQSGVGRPPNDGAGVHAMDCREGALPEICQMGRSLRARGQNAASTPPARLGVRKGAHLPPLAAQVGAAGDLRLECRRSPVVAALAGWVQAKPG
jgi:hypothetical protein